jgi:hypothetical protein
MGKLNVKNGTPVGNTHLCRNCSWAQFMTGYRDSDLLVICTNTSPNIVLPFTVYECSNFSDKHKPDWELMKKLAINIQPLRVSKKTRGFSVPAATAPAKRTAGEEEGESGVALARRSLIVVNQ